MKNPRIAFLLGLLPLLQGGCGMLSIWGPADYLHVGGLLLFFALGFFGWGWGYHYDRLRTPLGSGTPKSSKVTVST